MMKLSFHILAICGAAGFAGVMLSIGVTLGGYWRSLPAESFLQWFAANSQFVARSIPIVFVPTMVGLIGSLWGSWKTPAFALWAASTLCIVVVLILTIAYFVPTNTAFASNEMNVNLIADKLNQWLLLHQARIAFALIAAILGCIALSKS